MFVALATKKLLEIILKSEPQNNERKDEKRVKQDQLLLMYCSLKAQPLISTRYETVSENMFLQNLKMNNSFCAGAGYEFCLWKLQVILKPF